MPKLERPETELNRLRQLAFRKVKGKEVSEKELELANADSAALECMCSMIRDVAVLDRKLAAARSTNQQISEKQQQIVALKDKHAEELSELQSEWLIVQERQSHMTQHKQFEAPAGQWSFGHNFREGMPPPASDPMFAGWIPPGKTDIQQPSIRMLSRDSSSPDYLRLPVSSPLASSGAGGSLPKYVGAKSPDGTMWDWSATYRKLTGQKDTAEPD